MKSPQTNGICERFHKTVLQEFYQVAFRKKLYDSIDALQADLDQWLHYYNQRWSRKFGSVVKVDRMTKEVIQNEETKEPLARV